MRDNGKKIQFAANRNRSEISDPSQFVDMAISGDLENFKEYMLSYPEVVNIREKENGNVALHVASSKGSVTMVSMLLQRGASPNIQDIFGNTALHYAVDKKRKDIVELLINSGADVNLPDYRGNTALHVACVNSDVDIARMLLLHEADPEHSDLSNQRPIDKASNPTIKSLLERKISANRGGDNADTKQTLQWMSLGVGLGVGLGMAMAKQQQFFMEQQMAIMQMNNAPKKRNVVGVQHSTETPPAAYPSAMMVPTGGLQQGGMVSAPAGSNLQLSGKMAIGMDSTSRKFL